MTTNTNVSNLQIHRVNEQQFNENVIPANSLAVIEVAPTITEINALSGVTSNIQTQLNNKLSGNSAITGATKTKITYDSKGLVTAGADLTASDIPNLTLSKITDVTATATELNYVDGVTSNIQTQLNNKVASNSAVTAATTKKLVTYDTKGLVTGGSDLASSDVTGALGFTPYNATNPSGYQTSSQVGTAITNSIENVVTSTSTTTSLSANMGKSLQDQITNLKGIGRFLALWNCSTGLAESDPPTSPRAYNSGDYFIVGTVASGSANNYKPSGTEYVKGTASTEIESGDVQVNDVYFYDGTTWKLQINHGGLSTVSFANITGQPTDNTNLSTALSGKVTANSAITGATKCKITYDSKGLVTAGADLASSDVTTALGYTPYNATNPNGYQTETQVNTAITSYHDTSKVNANTAITGATKTKITYDSKGLVTAGADLSASDIPNLSISKITDITASATELNYCDGVTSNIQTQLNGKQENLPDQTSQSGKFLTTNGSALSWATVNTTAMMINDYTAA